MHQFKWRNSNRGKVVGTGAVPERLRKSDRFPTLAGNFCSRDTTPSGSVGSSTSEVAPYLLRSILVKTAETGRPIPI
jgi:hypothetical protein